MSQRGDTGVGKITISAGNIEEILGENDVVIENQGIFRKLLFQFSKELLNQGKFATRKRSIFIPVIQALRFIIGRNSLEFFACYPFLLQVTQYTGQNLFNVTLNCNIGVEDFFQLFGVTINLRHFFIFEQFFIPKVTGSFIKTGAEKDHQVGLFDNIAIGRAAGGDPETAKGHPGLFANNTFTFKAGGNRDI